MKEKLDGILNNALSQIDASSSLDKLNDIRVNFLGKKGELTSVLKAMKDVAPEDRPKVGQLVNEARDRIESRIEERKKAFEKALREEKMLLFLEKRWNMVIVIRIRWHWKKWKKSLSEWATK